MDTTKFKMGWMIVAFDLPTKEKEERKHYALFRKFLIEDGFHMIQYSVYARAMVTHARMQTHIRRIKQTIPPEGSIRVWYITEAQWQRSIVIHGKPAREIDPEALPGQIEFW
jgi:CRISPR-associated protein Cas2